MSSADAEPPTSQKLPPISHPHDNPPTKAKVALGRQLFFDTRLSRTGKIACATCHDPQQGWSDGRRVAIGVDDRAGTRSTPTLLNVAYQQHLFWDGRTATLEEQALQPIQNPKEMDLPLDQLLAKLNGDIEYQRSFRAAFGSRATKANLAAALACFERTILVDDLPIDRYWRGDEGALSVQAQRGMKLFYGDARCHHCHSGPNFTDGKFHNIGIGLVAASESRTLDRGRSTVTNRDADLAAFKTPTLREIVHTAPYMHDGSLVALEDVIKHYNFGGVTDAENPNRDEQLEVLYLADDQVADLITFLKEGLSKAVDSTNK